MLNRTDSFLTSSGRTVYALSPSIDVIDIEDIALSLARQCRFAGHIQRNVEHYSVAQHSVLVSYACAPEHALIGLLHDAAEAYLQDLIRPIKHTLGAEYYVAEARWASVIGARFGVAGALVTLPDDVKRADERVYATERRDVANVGSKPLVRMHVPLLEPIVPLRAFEARDLFLARFAGLWSGGDHG